jgi:N-glycosylase/DNA lyase
VDGDHWFQVAFAPTNGGFHYDVRSNAPKGKLAQILNMGVSLVQVRAEILSKAPELESCLSQLVGLRLLRPTCPAEVLFCFLCSANNHLARITQMVGKLSCLGTQFADAPHLHRFPSIERIAEVSESELREQGFGYRGRTIPIVARQLMERGEGFLDSLKSRPFSEARQELIQLAGVGPKLADCIALYGLHFDHSTPFDTHLWQAVSRRYYPDDCGKSLTELRYRRGHDLLVGKFGNLAGWAHLLLYYENLVLNRRGSA